MRSIQQNSIYATDVVFSRTRFMGKARKKHAWWYV